MIVELKISNEALKKNHTNMKKTLLILTIAFGLAKAHSQTGNDAPSIAKGFHSVSVNSLAMHYGYEHPIARTQTLFADIGLGADAVLREEKKNSMFEKDRNRWTLALYPAASLGYRNYYNIQKRARTGRKTAYNSANYLGVNIMLNPLGNIHESAYFEADKQTSFRAAAVWGLRRSLGKSFTFDFNIGPMVSDLSFKDGSEAGFLHAQWRFAYNF